MKKIVKKTPIIKKGVVKNSGAVKVANPPKKNSWLTTLAIVNVIAFLGVIVVNYLAVSLPIGWMTTWELSDLYPNLFVPAGLTFSIWGLIYTLFLGFVVWQLVDLYKKNSTGITKKIGIWFLLSCVANIGRMFAWQYQQVRLSVIIMLFFLVVLIVIANKVQLGKRLWTLWDKYLVQVPFSIYIGRISVATIANITTLLVTIWRNAWGLSDIVWTNIVIIVATILALLSLYKKYNIIYALVIIRAFIGIIIKRIDVDPVYASSIIWTLGICIAIISAGIWARREKRLKN
jgi:hypothetical protein